MSPTRNILLLSQPRSGTTLLCALLDSHPQVTFEREMLAEHKYVGWKRQLVPLFRRMPVLYLRLRAAAQARRTMRPIYGCKVFPDHLAHQPRRVLQLALSLNRAGWGIITLERHDVIARTFSLLVSYRTGLTHAHGQSSDIDEPFPFGSAFFLKAVRTVWIRDREFTDTINLLPPPLLRLNYEDALATKSEQQATANRVFTQMGVHAHPVATNLRPAWSRPYPELITNYHELRYDAERLITDLSSAGQSLHDIDGWLLTHASPAASAVS